MRSIFGLIAGPESDENLTFAEHNCVGYKFQGKENFEWRRQTKISASNAHLGSLPNFSTPPRSCVIANVRQSEKPPRNVFISPSLSRPSCQNPTDRCLRKKFRASFGGTHAKVTSITRPIGIGSRDDTAARSGNWTTPTSMFVCINCSAGNWPSVRDPKWNRR